MHCVPLRSGGWQDSRARRRRRDVNRQRSLQISPRVEPTEWVVGAQLELVDARYTALRHRYDDRDGFAFPCRYAAHAVSRIAADLDVAAIQIRIVAQYELEHRLAAGEGVDFRGHVHAHAQE